MQIGLQTTQEGWLPMNELNLFLNESMRERLVYRNPLGGVQHQNLFQKIL